MTRLQKATWYAMAAVGYVIVMGVALALAAWGMKDEQEPERPNE